MLDFFRSCQPLLGLDISDSDLRLIEISRRDNQYFIERCVSEKIVSQSLQEKQTRYDQESALQRLITASQIQGRQVAIAVSGPAVLTRIIQLDASLNEADQQEQIALGLEAWVPFQLETVLYDYEILGLNAVDPGLKDVQLAVAKRELIETQQQWIESAGLKVAVVDVASVALARAERLFVKDGEIASILNPDSLSTEIPRWLLALGLAAWGL